jgi:holo-[acyl-carrier protein] synthase
MLTFIYSLKKEIVEMIVGIGVDIVKVSRIEELLNGKLGERFKKKHFTEFENQFIETREHKILMYAAYFASKEAYMKAIGTGNRQGVFFKDIEIRHEPSGRPYIQTYGTTKEISDKLGIDYSFVSMAHEKEYAVAQVVVEEKYG